MTCLLKCYKVTFSKFWFRCCDPLFSFPLWLQEAGLVLGVWVSLPGFLWEKYIINEECAISLNTQGITPFNFVSDPHQAASAGFSWHTNTHARTYTHRSTTPRCPLPPSHAEQTQREQLSLTASFSISSILSPSPSFSLSCPYFFSYRTLKSYSLLCAVAACWG